jgi:hypothetical protein
MASNYAGTCSWIVNKWQFWKGVCHCLFQYTVTKYPGMTEENHRDSSSSRGYICRPTRLSVFQQSHKITLQLHECPSRTNTISTQRTGEKKVLFTVQPKFFIRHRRVSITACSRWFCNGDIYMCTRKYWMTSTFASFVRFFAPRVEYSKAVTECVSPAPEWLASTSSSRLRYGVRGGEGRASHRNPMRKLKIK